MAPFFSIVIPTRNRPELITYCLEALKLQSFTDFEVIVCDNHSGLDCRSVFEKYADERFRYVTPEKELPMDDNWEYACSLTKGRYVAVVIDKTILFPEALQKVYSALQQKPAELVCWWQEIFTPANEQSGDFAGSYMPAYLKEQRSPQYFDGIEELERRFRFDVRRGSEGPNYFYGKLCFGAYSRELIDRIIAKTGRLFHSICPDYTSMTAALALSRACIDMGEPLLMAMVSNKSNGINCNQSASAIKKFLSTIDAELKFVGDFPIPGVYASTNNYVAYDYLKMQRLLSPVIDELKLDIENVRRQTMGDLNRISVWQSPQERDQQYCRAGSAFRTENLVSQYHCLNQQVNYHSPLEAVKASALLYDAPETTSLEDERLRGKTKLVALEAEKNAVIYQLLAAYVTQKIQYLLKEHKCLGFFPAGKHSYWLADILRQKVEPEQLIFFDDQASDEYIGEYKLLASDDIEGAGIEALVISTDWPNSALYKRGSELFDKIIELYPAGELPLGGFCHHSCGSV